MTKIVKILKKISISSERHEEFQWHFQEKMLMGAHPVSREYFFEKNHAGGNQIGLIDGS